MVTTKTYDYLSRLTQISSLPSTSSVASSAYSYNSANQSTAATNADNARWVYTYDSLGQVISGKRYWSDGTPVAGQQFTYAFDDIGNRQTTASGGDQSGGNLHSATYTANNLNQYSSRTVPGFFNDIGSANSNATVTLWNSDGTFAQAYRHGEYFRGELVATNGSSALWLTLTNLAVLPNGTNADILTNTAGNAFIPKTPEAFAYDADGNLVSDGRWTNRWDAENRLVSVESLTNTPAASKRRLTFGYDHQGRRVTKTVEAWNGSIWTTVVSNRFLYDGWNLIAELNSTNNSVIRAYIWGLDLSGTIQAAGGVGGLLAVNDSAQGVHFVAFDGNGNVAALAKATDGTTSANYEYGAFGELLRATGPMARANPLSFSTKYQDDETGLIRYGFRYYNPSTGGWLSRDPIGEEGGVNLYGFVGNNGVTSFDPFGLLDTPSSTITPWELGWEWLTGDNPKHREFKDGDDFAELLRKHEHIRRLIKKAADEAARRCASGCNNKNFQITGEQGNYDLSGVQGVGKYLKDYSTLFTGGLTGNLAVTFLGSYGATLTATEISCCAGKAHVKLDINNSSTAASALRPPVLGYTEWWQKNIAPLINRLFHNGGGSPTTQHIELNENVTFKKSNCAN